MLKKMTKAASAFRGGIFLRKFKFFLGEEGREENENGRSSRLLRKVYLSLVLFWRVKRGRVWMDALTNSFC